MFEFAYPKFFWLFIILIPYILYDLFVKDKHRIKIIFPKTKILYEINAGKNSLLLYIPL